MGENPLKKRGGEDFARMSIVSFVLRIGIDDKE